jgi:hypothetical protein
VNKKAKISNFEFHPILKLKRWVEDSEAAMASGSDNIRPDKEVE